MFTTRRKRAHCFEPRNFHDISDAIFSIMCTSGVNGNVVHIGRVWRTFLSFVCLLKTIKRHTYQESSRCCCHSPDLNWLRLRLHVIPLTFTSLIVTAWHVGCNPSTPQINTGLARQPSSQLKYSAGWAGWWIDKLELQPWKLKQVHCQDRSG